MAGAVFSSLTEAPGAGRLSISGASDPADGEATVFSSCISDSQKTVSHILTYRISHAKPTVFDVNLDSERRKWVVVKAGLCLAISRV